MFLINHLGWLQCAEGTETLQRGSQERSVTRCLHQAGGGGALDQNDGDVLREEGF